MNLSGIAVACILLWKFPATWPVALLIGACALASRWTRKPRCCEEE